VKVKRLKKLDKIKITGNPKLFKKNLISEYNLKECVMFSYSELAFKQKTTKFIHKDILKFYFILSGQCNFSVNNNEYILKKDDLILIEPNEEYFLENKNRTLNKHLYAGFLL